MIIRLIYSEGSVIVDYFVELSDLGRTVNTADMRRLFHETLIQETVTSETFTSLNNNVLPQLKLGKFGIDPDHTDFTGKLKEDFNVEEGRFFSVLDIFFF